MPRYHFNFRSPDGAVIDDAGAEFANADAAYQAAVHTARTLMASESEIDWFRCVFEVRTRTATPSSSCVHRQGTFRSRRASYDAMREW